MGTTIKHTVFGGNVIYKLSKRRCKGLASKYVKNLKLSEMDGILSILPKKRHFKIGS
jgi:hypothetical protein